jgi:hypothetical protein
MRGKNKKGETTVHPQFHPGQYIKTNTLCKYYKKKPYTEAVS